MPDQLPNGWVKTTLGEVCSRVAIIQPEDSPGMEFTYFDIGGIDNQSNRIVGTKTLAGRDAPSRARQSVRKDDILFSTVRTYLKKIARIERDYNNPVASTGFTVIRAAEGVSPQFLFLQVLSEDFLQPLHALQTGSSYPAVRDKDVFAQPVRLAPSCEQERVVAKLDALLSRVAAGEAAARRALGRLQRYRAAVLHAAVTGELTRDWRKTHKPDETGAQLLKRILEQRRDTWASKRPYKEPTAPEATNLRDLPDSWCWATIGQVSECLDNMRVPVSKKIRTERHGPIPYYGANGQTGWIDDCIFDEPLVLVVEDETFTGRTQPFSYKISGKSWVNNHAHVLRPTAAVHVDFLNYSLARYPFTPLTTGTTGRRKLTNKVLLRAPYRLPPLAEQEQIAVEVERRLAAAERLVATLNHQLDRARATRQSLLREAFAGTLVSQDPKDEPASVLIDRIRAATTAEAKDRKKPKNSRGKLQAPKQEKRITMSLA